MIKRLFNESTSVLEAKFEGEVNILQIVEYIRETKDSDHYPRTLKILTDARNVIMNFRAEDLGVIVEANYKSLAKYDYIIDAFILDSPTETALSILFDELVKSNKYKFKIFSTIEAASKWLGNM